MKKFWLIVIIIVAFCILMYILSNNVPQIKDVANELVAKQKLPIWLVGLLAPIIYFFKSISKGFSGLFSSNGQEEKIEKENDRILKELEMIKNDISRIDSWRKEEIEREIAKIELLRKDLLFMDSRYTKIKNEFALLEGKSLKDYLKDKSDEEYEEWRARRDKELGIETN